MTLKHSRADSGTEHVVSSDHGGGRADITGCGMTVYGAPRVRSPAVAARVVENLCGNCKRALSDEDLMTLYELADESERGIKTA